MNLSERQSTKTSLLLLKAQCQRYSSAKIWWRWDFLLTVAATVLISVIRVSMPNVDLSLLAGCWAVAVTFLSFLWISPAFKCRRAEGAAIQDEFDNNVLLLEPNPLFKTAEIGDRGRDRRYRRPPAQIRT